MATAQFSGLASGIDSQTLIDSYVSAIQKKNDIRKQQVTDLSDQSDTLVTLKTKIRALNDLIDKFRTANAGGLARKASTVDSSVATATASAAAKNSSYSLTVTSLANTATGSFDQSYSASTSIVSAAGGDVTVTIGTGASQVVVTKTVTASTTLQDLVNSFNADSTAASKVVASAVNIGTSSSPDYRLVFSTLNSGTTEGTLALSSTTAELTASTINQATDAEFSIGGIGTSITRSSNTISDIISGVTLSLVDTGTTTITVANDADKTSTQIQEVVDSYNEIVKFIAENNTIERVNTTAGSTNVFGKLAKTKVDDQFLSTFRTEVAAVESTLGTAVTKLSQIGIITNRYDGSLIFNTEGSATGEDFKTAVANDPTGVADILNQFADETAGVDGILYQFTKTQGYIDNTIDSNNNQIDNLNAAIAQLDRRTDNLKERLTKQFSNLESVSAKMQNTQSQLSGILAGLNR